MTGGLCTDAPVLNLGKLCSALPGSLLGFVNTSMLSQMHSSAVSVLLYGSWGSCMTAVGSMGKSIWLL